MPAFNKQIVLDGIRDELERATQSTDAQFDRQLAAWTANKAEIDKGRDKARRIIEKITGENLSVQKKAELILEGTGRGGFRSTNVFDAASRDPGTVPARVRSPRERSLDHVVKLIESFDGETISATDLRNLGVMQFVKFVDPTC